MNWPSVQIEAVLKEARPGFACGEDDADGVFQFRMNNVTADGNLDLSKKRRVPRSSRKIETFHLRRGDVLFNATNSPELVGKTAFFAGYEEPVVFSNHFLRLRPDDEKLEGRYLARWLQFQFQRRVFQGMCRQWVNQATVGRDSLMALPIPLPPLAEQRRIATVLDAAEALRAKRRVTLAKLNSLTQSIFLEMFGDPLSNPKKWPTQSLQEIIAMPLRNGLSPSKSGRISAKVLTLSAITDAGFDPTALKVSAFQSVPPANQSVDTSDFLICRGNGNIRFVGRGCFPSSPMADVTFPDTMIAARIARDRIERAFLRFVWNGPAVRQQIESLARTTNGTFKVNQTMLEGIKFIAPNLTLQRDFQSRVIKIDALRDSQLSMCGKLDALFLGLQHRAFRGEL